MTAGPRAELAGDHVAVLRAALARMLLDPALVDDLTDPGRRGRRITELGLIDIPPARLRAAADLRNRMPGAPAGEAA